MVLVTLQFFTQKDSIKSYQAQLLLWILTSFRQIVLEYLLVSLLHGKVNSLLVIVAEILWNVIGNLFTTIPAEVTLGTAIFTSLMIILELTLAY
jgi:hypothetical protein